MTHINGSSADREKEMWELLLKQGSNVAKWRLHQAIKTLSFFVQIDRYCDKTHLRYPEMFKGGE